jgi:hypothetical protein
LKIKSSSHLLFTEKLAVAEDVADGAGDCPRAFWRLRRGFPVAISWSLSAEDFADDSASY